MSTLKKNVVYLRPCTVRPDIVLWASLGSRPQDEAVLHRGRVLRYPVTRIPVADKHKRELSNESINKQNNDLMYDLMNRQNSDLMNKHKRELTNESMNKNK